MLKKITDSKAFKIEGVLIKSEKMISVRQMYKPKGSENWLVGKSGITVPFHLLKSIYVNAKKLHLDDETPYEDIYADKEAGDGAPAAPKRRGRPPKNAAAPVEAPKRRGRPPKALADKVAGKTASTKTRANNGKR